MSAPFPVAPINPFRPPPNRGPWPLPAPAPAPAPPPPAGDQAELLALLDARAALGDWLAAGAANEIRRLSALVPALRGTW